MMGLSWKGGCFEQKQHYVLKGELKTSSGTGGIFHWFLEYGIR
jgi:hypothetical protein